MNFLKFDVFIEWTGLQIVPYPINFPDFSAFFLDIENRTEAYKLILM